MVDLFYYRTVNLNEEVKKEDEEEAIHEDKTLEQEV
jgi:hypothetical protein